MSQVRAAQDDQSAPPWFEASSPTSALRQVNSWSLSSNEGQEDLPVPSSPPQASASEKEPPRRPARRRDSHRSHQSYHSTSSRASRESSEGKEQRPGLDAFSGLARTSNTGGSPDSPKCRGGGSSDYAIGSWNADAFSGLARTSHTGGSPDSPKSRVGGSSDHAIGSSCADRAASGNRGRAANPPHSRFMELLRCLAEEHERVLSLTTATLISKNASLNTSLRHAHDLLARQKTPVADFSVQPISPKKNSGRRERAATMDQDNRTRTEAAAAAVASSAIDTKAQNSERNVERSPSMPQIMSGASNDSPKLEELPPDSPKLEDAPRSRAGGRTRSATLSRWHRAVDTVMKRGSTSCLSSSTSILTSSAPSSSARSSELPSPQAQPPAPIPPNDTPATLPLATAGESTPSSPKYDSLSARAASSDGADKIAAPVEPEYMSPEGTKISLAVRDSKLSAQLELSPKSSSKDELPSLLGNRFSVCGSGKSAGQPSKKPISPRRFSTAFRNLTAFKRNRDGADWTSKSASSASNPDSEDQDSEPKSPRAARLKYVPHGKSSTIGCISMGNVDFSQLRVGKTESENRHNTLPGRTSTIVGALDLTRDETTSAQITLLNHWQELGRRSPSNSLHYTQSNSNTQRNSRSWLQHQQSEEMHRFLIPDQQSSFTKYASKLVITPGSKRRISWDFLGMSLILYDLVSIPMQIFEPPWNEFSEVMSMLTTAFWTADIPFSFFTGFYREGVLEERLDEIARHYARTWLAFDIVVISVDWCLTIAGEVSSSMAADSVGYMRFGKTLRFLRLLRLLRLLKVHGVLSDLIERVQSEFCLIMLGIARVIVSIMLINHLIACSWYGIGTVHEGREDTWVFQNHLPEKELGYRYTTALHWSLTQFTPASMEVVPENALERVFAVCVLLFAMVTFSSLVSSITNAMTQLRNLNSEQHEQTATLRRYLGENKVSVALMGRIWGCMQQIMDKSKRRIHEKDVAILAMLPSTLKGDLQEEVYFPILATHPLFNQLGSTYPAVIRRIYAQAVEEVSTGVGQELFNAGDEASRMFFISSGVLLYSLSDKVGTPSAMILPGHFVTEAALWICWKHAGQLAATTHVEFVTIVQKHFFSAVNEVREPQRYAKAFAKHFHDCPEKLTDVFCDMEILQEVARQAFANEDYDVILDSCEEAPPSRMSTGRGHFTDMLMGLVPPMLMADRRNSMNSIFHMFTGGMRTPNHMESLSQDGSNDSDRERRDMDFAEDNKSDSASSKASGGTGVSTSMVPVAKNGNSLLEPPRQQRPGMFRRIFLSPSSSFNGSFNGRSSKLLQTSTPVIDETSNSNASSTSHPSSKSPFHSERSNRSNELPPVSHMQGQSLPPRVIKPDVQHAWD